MTEFFQYVAVVVFMIAIIIMPAILFHLAYEGFMYLFVWKKRHKAAVTRWEEQKAKVDLMSDDDPNFKTELALQFKYSNHITDLVISRPWTPRRDPDAD